MSQSFIKGNRIIGEKRKIYVLLTKEQINSLRLLRGVAGNSDTDIIRFVIADWLFTNSEQIRGYKNVRRN